jgi:hypothetical protein
LKGDERDCKKREWEDPEGAKGIREKVKVGREFGIPESVVEGRDRSLTL